MNAAGLGDARALPRGAYWLAVLWASALLVGFVALPPDIRDPLLLVAGVVTFAFALRHFETAWLVFLMALPILWLVTSLFGQPKITGARIMVLVLFPAFLLQPKPSGFWRTLAGHWAFTGYVLFVLANVVSGVAAGQAQSVFRAVSYGEPLIYLVLGYYVVRRRPANLERMIWIFVAGGLVVGALGLAELMYQRPLIELLGMERGTSMTDLLRFYLRDDRFGLGGRMSSTLLQPVYAAVYFSTCLLILVGYFGIRSRRNRKWLAVLVVVFAVLVLATGSRGPLLALLVALLAYMAFSREKGRAAIVAALGLGAVVIAANTLAPTMTAYLSESFDPTLSTSSSLFNRYDLTVALFDYFREKPVLGQGPGLIQRSALLGLGGFEGLGGLENQYAVILADGGLLAGAAYLCFAGGALSFAWKAYRSEDFDIHVTGMLLLVLAIFYFITIASVTALTDPSYYMLMCVLGGA